MTDGPDGRSDRALLAAHVAGDADAFGTLFARHRDRLWAVALRTMGNPEDAADALQDAMISAFRRADSFRGDAAVTTWLHRIVVNACLDRIRRRKVRAADPLPDDLDDYAGRGALSTAAPDAGPDEVAVAGDRRAQCWPPCTLPAEQRAALVLVDMEGYSVAEAAEILDCAVGTIKCRCSRGRARLAPLLGVLRADAEEPPEPAGNPPGPRPVPSSDPSAGHRTDAGPTAARPSPHARSDPRQEVNRHRRRELTPAQDEAVRRLLADARHDEPVPPEVAARLDDALAGLRAERAAATADVVPLRRRRRAAAVATCSPRPPWSRSATGAAQRDRQHPGRRDRRQRQRRRQRGRGLRGRQGRHSGDAPAGADELRLHRRPSCRWTSSASRVSSRSAAPPSTQDLTATRRRRGARRQRPAQHETAGRDLRPARPGARIAAPSPACVRRPPRRWSSTSLPTAAPSGSTSTSATRRPPRRAFRSVTLACPE